MTILEHMFDLDEASNPSRVRDWTRVLAESELVVDAAAQVDEIRALEELVCAAQARQLRLAGALDDASTDGLGVAQQVALARRESPHRGRQHLALARVAHELPHVMAAFRRGLVTEWRATVIARETACLTLDDRIAVDRAIAGDPDALAEYSDRVLLGELRKLVCRLDPASVAERRRRAESERRVTLRPAPDTMAYLTILLPVARAVSAYAALTAAADSGTAAGDARSRGQLMADTLVARVTGAPVGAGGRPVVPVAINLVMTDQALLTGRHDSAHLEGHGPIPADLARALVSDNLDLRTKTWLRRLYTSPETGELVAMDSAKRRFPAQLASFLRNRDQFCRSPWCNAPIRHHDHVVAVADGGDTTGHGGQGLCESCNYAKEAIGWRARPRPGPGHTIEIVAPTGHRYRSAAPPLLDLRRPAFRRVAEGRWVLVA